MVSKTTLGAAIAATIAATFWSPAVSDELQPIEYKVTVMEQVRHEITIKADKEYAARTVALLEARRTSGSPIQGGNRRRQVYWRMCMKPTTLL